jgi:endonuclease-3
VISLRTKDEVTAEASSRLLARAPNPEALSNLPEKTIARLIYPAGFYRNKAGHLRKIARTLLQSHGGKVPDTLEQLLELPGVGRKTANLVLTRGFGKPGVCVDTHVHRISNRLDFARTKTPDDTEQILRARLPKRWWIPINWIMVRYGQTVCTPISPHCSDCCVRHLCPKAGVDRHR